MPRSLQKQRAATKVTLLWAMLSLACATPMWSQTLEDFGHGKMETPTTMPVLTILVDNRDGQGIVSNETFWAELLYSPTGSNSLNHFLITASNGRYRMDPGQVITVQVETNMTWTAIENNPNIEHKAHTYITNILYKSMLSQRYDYAARAVNGVVTHTNMHHLILARDRGGQQLGIGGDGAYDPDSNIRIVGAVALSTMATNEGALRTMLEELLHIFGARDLYGVWGDGGSDIRRNLSIMFGDGFVDLDAWHKLQFGWSDPRIYNGKHDHGTWIPATQLGHVDTPVILYDPSRGTQEYHLLEYRTTNTSKGIKFERKLPDEGLLIWHVRNNDQGYIMQYADAAFPDAHWPWHECLHCAGLVHTNRLGAPTTAPCAASPNGHEAKFTDDHGVPKPQDAMALIHNNPHVLTQQGWHECNKCGLLFYGPNVEQSHCPAGDRHEAGATNYTVIDDPDFLVGHLRWRRCTKCQTLFFNERHQNGCPAGGLHTPDMTKRYALLRNNRSLTAMMSVGAPNHQYGGTTFWNNSHLNVGQLYAYDFTPLPYRLRIAHYDPGDDQIYVTWENERAVWVDFNYTGTVEDGSFDAPYKTIQAGYNNTPDGWTLMFKSGATPDTIHFQRPMTIDTYGGPTTIGQ